MKPFITSKGTCNIPDGVYAGRVSGCQLSLLTQTPELFDKKIELYPCIKGTVYCVAVIKNGVAYCYDKPISFKCDVTQ